MSTSSDLIQPLAPDGNDDAVGPSMSTSWSRVTQVLAFVFLLEFKPSEPFIEPYLKYDKNFTDTEVNDEIFPVWTYAYLAFAFVFGPLTELGTYTAVIIVGALARLSTRLLLLFGTSVLSMQLMQVGFGIGSATEFATSALLYTMVSAEHFQTVTSLVRAASLTSHVGAAELGQFFVDSRDSSLTPNTTSAVGVGELVRHGDVEQGMSTYRLLMCISLGSVSIAVLLAFTLRCESWIGNARVCIVDVLREWVATYSSWEIIIESIRTVGPLAVLNLCYNYGTSRFDQVEPPDAAHTSKNGHIVAGTRLLSSLLVLLAIRLRSVLGKAFGFVYAVLCTAAGGALLLTALAPNLLWCALAYSMSVGLLEFSLCLTQARTALAIRSGKYALVIGINTFIALVLQTIIQLALHHHPAKSIFVVLAAIISGYGLCVTILGLVRWRPTRVTSSWEDNGQSPPSASQST